MPARSHAASVSEGFRPSQPGDRVLTFRDGSTVTLPHGVDLVKLGGWEVLMPSEFWIEENPKLVYPLTSRSLRPYHFQKGEHTIRFDTLPPDSFGRVSQKPSAEVFLRNSVTKFSRESTISSSKSTQKRLVATDNQNQLMPESGTVGVMRQPPFGDCDANEFQFMWRICQ